MKTSKTETTKHLSLIERTELALAKATANKQAADAELDAKATEGERLDAELEAELLADAEPTPTTGTILMACDHACERCGNCPDRTPQTVDENDEELIAILEQPCDCETLGIEVRHIKATETKAA